MNLEALKKTLDTIKADLEQVGGEKHVKAASLRVRTSLGELKNAVPELRRELVKLDKEN